MGDIEMRRAASNRVTLGNIVPRVDAWVPP